MYNVHVCTVYSPTYRLLPEYCSALLPLSMVNAPYAGLPTKEKIRSMSSHLLNNVVNRKWWVIVCSWNVSISSINVNNMLDLLGLYFSLTWISLSSDMKICHWWFIQVGATLYHTLHSFQGTCQQHLAHSYTGSHQAFIWYRNTSSMCHVLVSCSMLAPVTERSDQIS